MEIKEKYSRRKELWMEENNLKVVIEGKRRETEQNKIKGWENNKK